MANLIIMERAPVGSSYDKWKIYSSTTMTGSFTLLATNNISGGMTYVDNTGTATTWYKLSYYDSIGLTESDKLGPMFGGTVNYTTPQKVASLLQIGTLSDTSSPSIQEITEVINRVEDIIDGRTGHAWRTRYSNTISGKDWQGDYENYDLDNLYEYQTGRPIYLEHRKIKQLSASNGDALQFWNGSDWEDWLATKTEGRNNDYWVDYNRGILYIKLYWAWSKPVAFRIKYRYGENIPDLRVEDIATKMAAMDILTGMDPRAVIVQEGSPVMSHRERIDKWQKEVDEKLSGLVEFKIPGGMQL